MNDEKPMARPGLPTWRLDVVGAHDVGPRMRRVVLTAPELDGLDYRPGQSLMLRVPAPEGDVRPREYTIRGFDRGRREVALDVLMHGDTPGPRWAAAAAPGARIEAAGPRGRTVFDPGADWQLFCGDETAIPAVQHMLERAPAGTRAFVFLEVADAGDAAPVETAADLALTWLRRDGRPAGPSALVLDAVSGFALPDGAGRAYLMGETSNVRALRHHLIGRGMGKAQIASEGYWRPGRLGGHDHVED